MNNRLGKVVFGLGESEFYWVVVSMDNKSINGCIWDHKRGGFFSDEEKGEEFELRRESLKASVMELLWPNNGGRPTMEVELFAYLVAY